MHGLEAQVFSAETNDDRGIGDAGQRRHEANTVKGLIAGLVGGLIAALVMTKFQALCGKSVEGVARSHGAQSLY